MTPGETGLSCFEQLESVTLLHYKGLAYGVAKFARNEEEKKLPTPATLALQKHFTESILYSVGWFFNCVVWFNDCVLGKSSEISYCESNTCEGRSLTV